MPVRDLRKATQFDQEFLLRKIGKNERNSKFCTVVPKTSDAARGKVKGRKLGQILFRTEVRFQNRISDSSLDAQIHVVSL